MEPLHVSLATYRGAHPHTHRRLLRSIRLNTPNVVWTLLGPFPHPHPFLLALLCPITVPLEAGLERFQALDSFLGFT